MSYKNYNWAAFAREYNSPYLRNRLWTHSFFRQAKLLGNSRVAVGICSRNNQIEYLVDFSTWAKAYEELKDKVLHDYGYLEELINRSIECGEKLNDWTENNIFEKGLGKLTDQEVIALLREFVDMQEDECAYGAALPILDFQDFSFVEANLTKFLKEKVPEAKFEEYYSLFTAPGHNSFAQDQEESLLKLAGEFWADGAWRDDIKEKSFEEIKDKHQDFYSKLSQHARKYGWVYYVYAGPAFSEKDFYAFVVDYVDKGIDPRKKLDELQERKERNAKLRESYLQEVEPEELDAFILRIAGRVVWAKSRRKDHQIKSYYHAEGLVREIAKRLFISLEQVRSAPVEVLERGLAGANVDWTFVNNITNFHICLPNDDGSVTTMIGDEAEEFSKKFIKRSEETPDLGQLKELRGAVACPGKAIGTAKIINCPEDMAKMEYGDILVSAATTPSIVPAMKKAAAIITDVGGLTCHAAIVSRELNIPCIVGLKVATRMAKDGDRLEVDTGKARVRKLN